VPLGHGRDPVGRRDRFGGRAQHLPAGLGRLDARRGPVEHLDAEFRLEPLERV
jgi:hypothetical protein